jgi:hypothetical protein
MNRMFEMKKQSFQSDLEHYSRSRAMAVLGCESTEREWRAVLVFRSKTLVKGPDGSVSTAGPVVCGIRYLDRFLWEAPHPLEIVTIFQPDRVFHPNCTTGGSLCLGHPSAGLTLETILNQVWAGLNLNMKVVDTRPGNIANHEAARWVAANAHLFPLSSKGLLEEPD